MLVCKYMASPRQRPHESLTAVPFLQEAPDGTDGETSSSPERKIKLISASKSESAHYRAPNDPNQDKLIEDGPNGVYAVFDGMGGMGGHRGGHEASQIAQGVIHEKLRDIPAECDPESALAVMESSFSKAAAAIQDAEQKDHKLAGMGTTAVALKVVHHEGKEYAVWTSVGDSPFLLYSKDTGSWNPVSTEDLAFPNDPHQQNVLSNVLNRDYRGITQDASSRSINSGIIPLEPGMRLALLSDGITGDTPSQKLSPKEYRKCFEKETAADCAQAFMETANPERDSQKKDDDSTVVVIDIAPIDPNKSASGRQRGSRGGKTPTSSTTPTPAPVRPGTIGSTTTSSRVFGVLPEPDDPYADLRGMYDTDRPDLWGVNPDDIDLNPDWGTDTDTHQPDDPTGPIPVVGTDGPRVNQVTALRSQLAEAQNKKRWGLLYGLRKRGEMQEMRVAYDAEVRDVINDTLEQEIADGVLQNNYKSVAPRKIELLRQEAEAFFAAMASENRDVNLYSRAVGVVGDALYGKDRKLPRKAVVGFGLLAGGLVLASVAPAAALALPAVRMAKIGVSGVRGHDSQRGTARVFSRLRKKGDDLLASHHEYILENESSYTRKKLDEFKQVGDGAFIDAYLNRVNKDDTKRRVASFVGQALAVGSILGIAQAIGDTRTGTVGFGDVDIDSKGALGGEDIADNGSASSFNNLTEEDIASFREASPDISDDVLQNIDQNPEQFEHFTASIQQIEEQTGLTGDALNERVGKTLELADAKNMYIDSAISQGVTREIASQTFDTNFKHMVNMDRLASTVEELQSSGLSGTALEQRVGQILGLAQARENYILEVSGKTQLSEVTYQTRQELGKSFDDMFHSYIQRVSRQ